MTTRAADRLRQAAVVLAFLGMVVVNALANALPIAGRTSAEVSDRFQSPFTPAGFTFAVWAVIYLMLGAHAVYQALPASRTNPRLRATGWPFVISCVLNAVWLVAWHNLQIGLSVVLMLALLATLAAIYARLRAAPEAPTAAEGALARLPFSLYLGWISVATVANASAWLVSLGVSRPLGIPDVVWAGLMALVAAGLGAAFARAAGDAPFNLVLLWALAGIVAAQPGITATSVLAGVAALVILAGLATLRRPPRAGTAALA